MLKFICGTIGAVICMSPFIIGVGYLFYTTYSEYQEARADASLAYDLPLRKFLLQWSSVVLAIVILFTYALSIAYVVDG